MIFKHKRMTASGIVTSLPCYWGGCFGGNDRTNDPQYTVYDDVRVNASREVLLEHEHDASAKGMNGFTLGGDSAIDMERGMYVAMSGTNAKMVFLYRNKVDCE